MRIEKWIEKNEGRVDSHGLFREWVEMHSTHNSWREEQASIIARILLSLPQEHPTVVDLVCGAGGLSEVLLRLLPGVRIIAVDPNPFLLMIYRNHLAEYGGRFVQVQGDIRGADAFRKAGSFHAAVSFTSFHNFTRHSILQIYRSLYQKLPRSGIFATGDVTTLSDPWFEALPLSAKAPRPRILMDDFWSAIKSRYGIEEEIDEMNAQTSIRATPEHGYPPSFYVNSLRWAGFEMADIVFQAGNRLVYCARRV